MICEKMKMQINSKFGEVDMNVRNVLWLYFKKRDMLILVNHVKLHHLFESCDCFFWFFFFFCILLQTVEN